MFHSHSTDSLGICQTCYGIGHRDGESSGSFDVKYKLQELLKDVWPETSIDELYDKVKEIAE